MAHLLECYSFQDIEQAEYYRSCIGGCTEAELRLIIDLQLSYSPTNGRPLGRTSVSPAPMAPPARRPHRAVALPDPQSRGFMQVSCLSPRHHGSGSLGPKRSICSFRIPRLIGVNSLDAACDCREQRELALWFRPLQVISTGGRFRDQGPSWTPSRDISNSSLC